MKTKVLLVSFLFALFSCEEVDLSEKGGESQEPSFDFEVPAGFAWDVHKSVKVSVKIADQYSGGLNYGVEIYDGEKLLDRGFVKGGEDYSTIVVVEKITAGITVVQLDPNGRNAIKTASLNGNSLVEVDFNAAIESVSGGGVLSRSGVSSRSGATSSSVPSDAIVITANITEFEAGKTYVLRSYTKAVTKAEGVILYIDAKGIFQIEKGIKLSNSTIHILSGGRLVGKTTEQHQNLNIINNVGGEINIYGDLEMKDGSFINHSDVFFYNMYLKDVELKTNGLLLIGVRKPDGSTGGFDDIDHPKDYTGVDFETETGMVTLENTTVAISDHFVAENIKSDGGEITFHPHAWINVTNKMTCVNTTIVGSDDKEKSAVVKAKALSIDKKANVQGRIVLDTEDGISVGGNDHWGKNVNHGAVNPEDETSIASIYHYILKYTDGGYNATFPGDIELPDTIQYFSPQMTILMEDGTPGDMDMNDMVCEWELGTLKDVDNKVTKFGLRYEVIALGGTKELAGAVALRGVDRANIRSVKLTKNHSFDTYFTIDDKGLESGNSDVVIPLFEDAHKTFFKMNVPDFVNTFNVTESSYTFEVEVELIKPIQIEELSRSDMDFFLVINGDMNKRTEINLFGNSLTSKASNTEFDFTAEHFVAGVEFVEGFSYPKELVPIQEAFPDFKSWVTSGGTNNEDWYKYPVDNKVVQRSSSK